MKAAEVALVKPGEVTVMVVETAAFTLSPENLAKPPEVVTGVSGLRDPAVPVPIAGVTT